LSAHVAAVCDIEELHVTVGPSALLQWTVASTSPSHAVSAAAPFLPCTQSASGQPAAPDTQGHRVSSTVSSAADPLFAGLPPCVPQRVQTPLQRYRARKPLSVSDLVSQVWCEQVRGTAITYTVASVTRSPVEPPCLMCTWYPVQLKSLELRHGRRMSAEAVAIADAGTRRHLQLELEVTLHLCYRAQLTLFCCCCCCCHSDAKTPVGVCVDWQVHDIVHIPTESKEDSFAVRFLDTISCVKVMWHSPVSDVIILGTVSYKHMPAIFSRLASTSSNRQPDLSSNIGYAVNRSWRQTE